MKRRDFLKFGGGMLATGALAMSAPLLGANAAFESSVLSTKPVYRPDGWKGAKVRYLDYPGGAFDVSNPRQVDLADCSNLGTSKIVGNIVRRSQLEDAFIQFDLGKYGDPAELRKQAGPSYFSPMGGALVFGGRLTGAETSITGDPAEIKQDLPDPATLSRHIKDMAMFLYADDCGIGILPEQAIYTHQCATNAQMAQGAPADQTRIITNKHPYCIVMLYSQDFRNTLMASTGYDGGQIGARRAYLMNGIMADVMARYIRNLGYEARAHHNEDYEVMVTPCLISAGMGELSRVGDCVLHPYLGYNYKAAVVTTNLQLMPDHPIDFGVQDFCRVCKKCAENCPSKSISLDDYQEEYNGYMKYKLDYKSCAIFRRTQPEGYGCGRCAVVCPWSSKEESWFHSLASYLSSMKNDAFNRLIKNMDDICGYGTEVATEYKSWLGYPGT
jgi:reductive dehalogenase